MSGFDADAYASFWQSRNEAEKNRIRERTGKALTEAERVAVCLKHEAGAEKVVLFGSLAENNVRNDQFDIDLAVWGCNWYRAREIVEQSPFKIDIVEYENLPPHLKKRIDTRGRIL